MPLVKTCAFLLVVTLASMAAGPRDALSRARQLYNLQQYDAAIDAASQARRAPNLADAADLVSARAYLERFRRSASGADLTAARDALARIQAAQLAPIERVELMVALAESLYLDDRAGAAAEEFEIALGHVDPRSAGSRERILDWWASAMDRQAQLGPEPERRALYTRLVGKMEEEVRQNPGSAVASYWLVAGARGRGDLERAWDAAVAGWVRASLAGSDAASLRSELDRIVSQAILPERARQMSARGDSVQAVAAMRREWDTLKMMWPNR